MLQEGLERLLHDLKRTTQSVINLSQLEIDDVQVKQIARVMANLSFIKEVDLCNNRIGSEGAIELAKVPLTSLDLSGNIIGDLGAVALLKSQTLEKLFIANNHIHTTALMSLPSNHTLHTLNLASNHIGDDLPQVFKRDEGSPKMNLSLRANNIGDEVAKVLAKGNFSVLDLFINYINDEGAKVLQESMGHNISQLDLRMNNCENFCNTSHREIKRLLHHIHPINDIEDLFASLEPKKYLYPLEEKIQSGNYVERIPEIGAQVFVAQLLSLNDWFKCGVDYMLCDVSTFSQDYNHLFLGETNTVNE